MLTVEYTSQDFGITALHWPAAEMNTHTEACFLLLTAGRDHKKKDNDGRTPNRWAKASPAAGPPRAHGWRGARPSHGLPVHRMRATKPSSKLA